MNAPSHCCAYIASLFLYEDLNAKAVCLAAACAYHLNNYACTHPRYAERRSRFIKDIQWSCYTHNDTQQIRQFLFMCGESKSCYTEAALGPVPPKVCLVIPVSDSTSSSLPPLLHAHASFLRQTGGCTDDDVKRIVKDQEASRGDFPGPMPVIIR